MNTTRTILLLACTALFSFYMGRVTKRCPDTRRALADTVRVLDTVILHREFQVDTLSIQLAALKKRIAQYEKPDTVVVYRPVYGAGELSGRLSAHAARYRARMDSLR